MKQALRARQVLGLSLGLIIVVFCNLSSAADWPRFHGPAGSGVSPDKGPLPVTWSETENLKWKTKLPGPGSSSPIVVGNRVVVTCWTGYGTDPDHEGEQKDLRRHVICLDRQTGKILWDTEVEPVLPEDPYSGQFTQHGYTSHTPASDGKQIYVFFGKTGVLAFDLEGKQLWQTSVGTGSGSRGWGTASSPILYKDLVIVPASAESNSLVALNKADGKEVWRYKDSAFTSTWGTPVLVDCGQGHTDLVIAVPYKILGFDPDTGKLRWHCDGLDSDSICTSALAGDGTVYVLETGPRGGGTVAVRPAARAMFPRPTSCGAARNVRGSPRRSWIRNGFTSSTAAWRRVSTPPPASWPSKSHPVAGRRLRNRHGADGLPGGSDPAASGLVAADRVEDGRVVGAA